MEKVLDLMRLLKWTTKCALLKAKYPRLLSRRAEYAFKIKR